MQQFEIQQQSLFGSQDKQLLVPKAHQTIEYEKSVSNGYCMLFAVFILLLFSIFLLAMGFIVKGLIFFISNCIFFDMFPMFSI